MTHATLTATIWREASAYVSLCPELGVASCGDDPDEALAMLKEAVELYVENARKLGIWKMCGRHRIAQPLHHRA